MVDKPNMDPKPPVPPSQPQPPATSGSETPGKKSQYQQWNPKPLKWLGMQFTEDETKKLWNIISQTVSTEISKDKDKAIKAIKKMNPNKNRDD